VALLTHREDYVHNAVVGFLIMSIAISGLIAIPILRKRVVPPCIRVKGYRSGIYNIIGSFFAVAFCILFLTESLRSLKMMLLLGPFMVSLIILLILILFEKIEICENGVWQWDGLQLWEEYESFSWKWKTQDDVELRLVSKSWLGSARLIVPPEAVKPCSNCSKQIYADPSAIRMNS